METIYLTPEGEVRKIKRKRIRSKTNPLNLFKIKW